MFFSIAIPVYNELNSLRVLLPALCKTLDAVPGHEFEILVVDDCSTDGTKELLKQFSAAHPNIKPVFLERRSGQTGAFREAFARARGEAIIRMDGDLQDSPEDLPQFFRLFEQGADLIMGLRECRKHPRFYRLMGYLYDAFVVLLFNSPLQCNSGSFVGFRSKFVKDVRLKGNDHRFLPLIVMERGAKNIREVFVRHGERQFGTSKYRLLSKLFIGFFDLMRFFVCMKSGCYKRSGLEQVLKKEAA